MHDLHRELLREAAGTIIEAVGESPEREGLLDTPSRFAKAWEHWSAGYGMSAREVLKAFEDGADGCDEMVVQRDIPFYSHCEHHLAPFFGTVDIAYIPNGRVIGLSKFKRLVDVYALRLQVQERMTTQIAEALMEVVGAKGVGVIVRARHLCMESRGVRTAGTHTVTSKLLGVMHESPLARSEFLALTK